MPLDQAATREVSRCRLSARHTRTGCAERARHHRARSWCVARTQQHIAMPVLGFIFVPVGFCLVPPGFISVPVRRDPQGPKKTAQLVRVLFQSL